MEKYVKQGWEVVTANESYHIVDSEGQLVAKVPKVFAVQSRRKDGDAYKIALIMAASAKLYEALNMSYNKLGRLGELTPEAFKEFVEEALREAEGK